MGTGFRGGAQFTPPCCPFWAATVGAESAQGRGKAEGDGEGEDGLRLASGRVAGFACEWGWGVSQARLPALGRATLARTELR